MRNERSSRDHRSSSQNFLKRWKCSPKGCCVTHFWDPGPCTWPILEALESKQLTRLREEVLYGISKRPCWSTGAWRGYLAI